jgi:hypothetical protein
LYGDIHASPIFINVFLGFFNVNIVNAIIESYCVGTGTLESFFCRRLFLSIIFTCSFEVVFEFLRMPAHAASRRKLSSVPVCGLYVDLHELAFHFFYFGVHHSLFVTHARHQCRVLWNLPTC